MITYKFTNVKGVDGTTHNKYYIEGTEAERLAMTEITNGSEFLETDTGKTYIFNPDSAQWTQKATGGGGGGTSDYTQLSNKPQINSTTLNGNLSALDLDIFDVKSGNAIPSGEETGQLFLLLVDVGTVKKGLYRYNGSTWDLVATAGATFETYEWETTLSNGEIIYEETIKGE